MSPARRLALLRRLAWSCALLVLAVTSLSATLRLERSGLGCADWPRCYGQVLREPQADAPRDPGPALHAARLAHRIAAVAALAAVLAMLVLSVGARPRLPREAALAAALLALTLFLAVLGRWTASARVPAVTIGNLTGGLAMIALAARLTLAGSGPAARASGWTAAAVAVLLLQAALGGLTSGSFAGIGCTDWSSCRLAAAGVGWDTLDPWREPLIGPGGGSAEPGALAQLLHRVGALPAALLVLAAALRTWRRGSPAAAVLLAVLLLAQVAIGMQLTAAGLPLWLAALHNAGAALLVFAASRFVH